MLIESVETTKRALRAVNDIDLMMLAQLIREEQATRASGIVVHESYEVREAREALANKKCIGCGASADGMCDSCTARDNEADRADLLNLLLDAESP